MKYFISVLLLIGVLFTGCVDEITELSSQDDTFALQILSNSEVDYNGDVMTIGDFQKELEDLTNPENVIVQLNVSDDAPMGAVTDVQKMLREKGALKINYSMRNQ
ncbi:MAG: hypothetical protein U5J63_15555 [Fodinibius sp.]|nr:hypothetical protein [Fodinibius sp.]